MVYSLSNCISFQNLLINFKANSSDETNTKNILIIVFVLFGVVLIAVILVGAFAYWRYKK